MKTIVGLVNDRWERPTGAGKLKLAKTYYGRRKRAGKDTCNLCMMLIVVCWSAPSFLLDTPHSIPSWVSEPLGVTVGFQESHSNSLPIPHNMFSNHHSVSCRKFKFLWEEWQKWKKEGKRNFTLLYLLKYWITWLVKVQVTLCYIISFTIISPRFQEFRKLSYILWNK